MELKNYVFKALEGNEQAMEMLYNATYPKLRAVTVSILKNEDDAEDIIQDSYIKAFSSLHQLENAEKFEGWLCRIASNKCKDYLKKHKPVLFSDIESEDDAPFEWSIEDDRAEYNPEDVVISEDTRRQLMELINSLPDEQRICLVYYAVEEMKISEIAELLEVSESTVKSRLKYAKDKMKNKIEELEKKGVKLRSLSGFALIPFLHYLFATEAKAASALSFVAVSEAIETAATTNSTAATANVTAEGVKTIVTEAARQAGTKATAGIVSKIISAPIAAKVVAGIVAAGITVSVPVAIYQTVSDNSEITVTVNENVQQENVIEQENNVNQENDVDVLLAAIVDLNYKDYLLYESDSDEHILANIVSISNAVLKNVKKQRLITINRP